MGGAVSVKDPLPFVQDRYMAPNQQRLWFNYDFPKLKEMYIEDIVNYGKDNQGDTADNQSDSDQSD